MHLRNELARNGRELTAAVLRAAEIEKELEAFNTWTDPDTPQSDGALPLPMGISPYQSRQTYPLNLQEL